MADAMLVELDGKTYRWNGTGWACVADYSAPTTTTELRLNAKLAVVKRAAEDAAFVRTVAVGRKRALRVLVTGARTWTDEVAVRRELEPLPAGSVVIHGDANGADRIAGRVAVELGLTVIPCPADWATLGKSAWLRRNEAMLDEHHPDAVLAFHADLNNGKGTSHMVRIARAAGVPVRVVAG